MFKDYNKVDELNKETLMADMDFIRDASEFLSDREGINEVMTPSEVYDAFMEHMRFQDMNEITALRDLEYAQNADLEGKQRFGRLIDAYDKVNEDISGTMLLDYGEALLTAPSTYLGILTGGAGKAATVAGTQAAKFGVRKILNGAMKAAAVEGALGAGQGAMQEGTRVETGIQEKFTGERTLAQGVAQGVTGGLINLPVGALQVRKANKANEKYAAAKTAEAQRANVASEKTKDVLATAKKENVDKVNTALDALDPKLVAEGRRLKQDLQPGDTLEAALGSEVIDNLRAAATRVIDDLELKPGERITSGLHRLLDEGKVERIDDVAAILDEHNLTMDQFSLVFLAEVSEAGKTLGSMSRLRKIKGKSVQTEVGKLLSDMDNMSRQGMTGMSGEVAEGLLNNGKGLKYLRDLDRMRLGLMTSQPATTGRNVMNAGFRVGVDAVIRAADNVMKLRNPLSGTGSVAGYLFNRYEANMLRRLYTESFPEEAAMLFRDAADVTQRAGSETTLGVIGRKVNFLNTAADNMFKSAVFSASLKRRLKDNGIDLNEVITKGEFSRIPLETFKEATEDAYEFVYQSGMKGDDWFSKGARGVIKVHHQVPFAISLFLPFPRFVANQLKFIYETAPFLGLMPLDRLGSKLPARSFKEYMQDKMPKQIAGGAMLTAAYMWRVQQGDSTYWYEFKDDTGKYVDGRPVYGPFAPYMLMADYIYRYQNGTLPTSISRYAKDTAQALLGSTFRTGTGLYLVDKMWQDISDGRSEKAVAETLGNFLNSFTLPAAVARDIAAAFDPDERRIRETRPGTGDRVFEEADTVNFWDVVYKKATRSMPKFLVQDYDSRDLIVATQTGAVSYVSPLEKQLFGLGKREKNPMLEEMAKLNLYPTDIYRRPNNENLDLLIRTELSRDGGPLNLNTHMERFISSEEYKSLPYERQYIEFTAEAAKVVADATKIATARIENRAAKANRPYSELEVQKFIDTPEKIKRTIRAEYKQLTGRTDILEDRNETVNINGVDVNVMVWAVSRVNSMSSSQARITNR